MQDVHIRHARADEAETLSGLGVRTFVDTFGHLYKPSDLSIFLRTKHSVEKYQSFLDDPLHAVWIAERGGLAVGYAVAGPCDLPVPDLSPRAGELVRVYLVKEAQGGGLGRRLVEETLAWLGARHQPLYISVWSENARAYALYASLGFRKVHEYFFMVGEQADAEWILRRD
ncbi:MAG: GNAT family N-acetyltransferase [Parvularculaceae bacterium]|nr:GNAT family N-acetyltransferase [Parvularculaceae bacterium]